ncbi:MAG: universal stress protein [Thermodesulfobacteriota bacterium]
MIKNILVPQDGSRHSLSALKYAVWLAGKFKASLTGLYVVDIVSLEGPFLHDISASIGFEPFLNFSTKMKEILEARGKTVLASFEEASKDASIPAQTLLKSGIVANEICESATLADLVVLGARGANEEFDSGLLGSVTEAVLRKSAKPVLVAPGKFEAPENPLLAYDGSPNASDAMHLAAELVKACELPLTVATVSKEGADDRSQVDAADYLKPYNIKTDFVELKGDNAPARIAGYYEEKGYDLLFMGATHRSRVVEMVLGSTAESVMRAVKGPFFIVR